MELRVLRLECLKIAATRNPDHGTTLETAKSYFEFCTEANEGLQDTEGKRRPGRPRKNTGNVDPLS